MPARQLPRIPVLLQTAGAYGTLAAVRALGRAAVPVIVADPSRFAPARWSKYTARRLTCPSVNRVDVYLRWLVAFGAAHPGTALCPTNDELAWLFARHLPDLRQNFRVAAPPPETLLELLDKRRLQEACARAGLPTMASWFPGTEKELERLAPELEFPVVVKPRTQLFHRTRFKGGVAADVRSLRVLWRRLSGNGCTEPGLRRVEPGIADPFVQTYAPVAGEGVLSLSGFVDRTGEVFVVRAARKVVLRPFVLDVGVWFETASVDPALAALLRDLCRQTGYFGVFEAEFVRWKGVQRLIDFNPRFYGEMGFDQAQGLPLAELSYLTALGEDDAARELARESNGQKAVGPFVHRFALRFEKKAALNRALPQGPASALSNGAALDFAKDRDDPLPALLDAVNILAGYLRHPRSALRLLRPAAEAP